MSTRVLIRVVLVVLVLASFVVGPQIWNRSQVVRNAAGYRRAELIVTGSGCVGGQPQYDSRGHQTGTSPEYCTLKGMVDGSEQELGIDKGSIPKHPEGSRIAVWFNPAMPANGINYDTLRVRWGDVDDVGAYERRALRTLTWLAVLPAILTVLVDLLIGRARRFGSAPGEPDTFRVVTLSRQAPIGIPLIAFGLTLLWLQGPSVAWAGVILGLLLVAIGGALASPSVVELDRAARVWSRHRALGPLAFLRSSESWPESVRVGWAKTTAPSAADRGPWVVEVRMAGDTRPLGAGGAVELARDRARELAAFLTCPVDERPQVASDEMFPSLLDRHGAAGGEGTGDDQDDEAQAADGPTASRSREPALGIPEADRLPPAPEQLAVWRVARTLPIVLLVLAAAAVFLVPSVAGRLGRAVVDPLTGMPMLQGLGLELMARDRSDANVLELVRLANCLDPDRDAVAIQRALASLGQVRGAPFDPSAGMPSTIAAANRWAAGKLGRSLDANGGVMTWYEPHRVVRNIIDRMGSLDRNDAWVAWDHFGAGVLNSPSQFVCAAGPAFADPRPIHFAIKRGSFSGYSSSTPPPFEGQPVPIEDYADSALVTTVGAAVALEYWTHEGVGTRDFPDDFAGWWREWAPEHRLPPLPDDPSAR